jgi:SAM-dependent methyltransferase
MMFVVQILNDIYCLLINFLLILTVKPFLRVLKQIVDIYSYEKFSYSLLEFTNYLFPQYAEKSKSANKEKYDIRVFRDTYDRRGMDLYFKYFSPEETVKNKSVLDFGCGVGGKDAEFLKYEPKKIVGIDLSARNLKYAKELINEENKEKLFFYKKDINSEKEKFDLIVSFTVFEHIDKELLQEIVNQMYRVLSIGGVAIIVFNHFKDKFGTHTSEYIYNPWPQMVFEDSIIYGYWNKKLKEDKNVTVDSYFPPEYKHGIGEHNTDCFMNLNQVTIEEFERIIQSTKFKYERKYLYRQSFLCKLIPFICSDYLKGSAIYFLKKD